MKGAPDLVDAMAKMPLLVTDGIRVLEKHGGKSGDWVAAP